MNSDLNDRLQLQQSIDGTEMNLVEFVDAVVSARYDLTDRWDIGLGIQNYSRRLNVAELAKKYQSNNLFMTIGHSF
ncbi:hypothetical protein [Primorskyibacter sp. S87]|uniref:hypothetical protein n=1 Tax=Primorskyibacter sp. S87 TaxID=3415126 RepID=UPI003C7D0CE8